MPIKHEAYEVVEERFLPDLNADGILLRHKKSGARLFLLPNADENKVFSIAFRTPPVDDTGLTHILEHSVLCGSADFPVKDPFVELAKGSLNTFLNAMTYPDKTVYPVASCNDQDFKNLMHVYLDAVFYPNIYRHEEIFRQEGWHYELDEPDGELIVNGVVYNEMKGAFSSPEGVLEREILNSLFPDTPYGFESGGDPAYIPTLTYEKFLDFHRTYYHPSNSYIYLYGNMDMEERLTFLDEKYLSRFERIDIDTQLPLQAPFEEVRRVEKTYSVTEDDSLEGNTYLSMNYCMGTSGDRYLYTALDILDYCLLSAPGAPLKQALLDAGIGEDILSSADGGLRQPTFSIIAKGADPEDAERFEQVIRETLTSLAENGLDRKSVLAGIGSFEFRYREADAGRLPIGLSYGLGILDSWLYDEADPFMHLQENEVYAYLRREAENGYFEGLIRTYLLENPHCSLVMIVPERGLTAKTDAALAEKMASYKAQLSAEEVQALVDATAHLKAYQSEPSTQEELETIPLLALKDIRKTPEPFCNRIVPCEHAQLLLHDVETKGIAYVDLYFDADHIAQEDLAYLSILSDVLGYVDTANHSFRDLANEINIHTGGIGLRTVTYAQMTGARDCHVKFAVSAKSLYGALPKTFELIEEILFTSKLEDDKRLKEILLQMRSRMQMLVSSSGHSLSALRGQSYFSAGARISDEMGGVAYYRVLEDLTDRFEERKEAFKAKLSSLLSQIQRQGLFTAAVTADFSETSAEHLDESLVNGLVSALGARLHPAADSPACGRTANGMKNEGFRTASKVNYVARCGNFRTAGYEYTGSLNVLRVIMGYDYLWSQLRVLGGAYGCMSSFDRNGDSYFVSYRDPHLARTIETYENIPAYLASFDVSDRDMVKFIIGTVSGMDTPLTPSSRGSRSTMAYFTGLTQEMLQKERTQVLETTVGDIRALAPYVQAILDTGSLCVVGDESKITQEAARFGTLETLQ